MIFLLLWHFDLWRYDSDWWEPVRADDRSLESKRSKWPPSDGWPKLGFLSDWLRPRDRRTDEDRGFYRLRDRLTECVSVCVCEPGPKRNWPMDRRWMDGWMDGWKGSLLPQRLILISQGPSFFYYYMYFHHHYNIHKCQQFYSELHLMARPESLWSTWNPIFSWPKWLMV